MNDPDPLSHAEEPRVLDTYSVAYALALLFLVPGVSLMTRLPFGDDRSGTYSFAYVSLVTVPFLLSIVTTFLLDTTEGVKRTAIRIAVLTPLVLLTGVTVMFGVSMIMIPASKFLGIADQGLSVGWWVGLAVVAAPLVVYLVRHMAHPGGWRGAVELTAVALATIGISMLAVFSFGFDVDIYAMVRKDVVIYLVGAMSWYAPSFGLAAGLWRRSGLV